MCNQLNNCALKLYQVGLLHNGYYPLNTKTRLLKLNLTNNIDDFICNTINIITQIRSFTTKAVDQIHTKQN